VCLEGVRRSKMASMNQTLPAPAAPPVTESSDRVDEAARVAAIGRLCDLFSGGEVSYACFSAVLDQVFAARGHLDLESAMQALPPLVRLTPSSRRLAKPLALHAVDGGLQLGSGWQLAAETTVRTGVGSALIDLTAARGSIEVLVPKGVAVQMAGGAGRVRLEALSAPVPGGPVLRISTSGPAGEIRIRHSREPHHNGPLRRLRRRRTDRTGWSGSTDRRPVAAPGDSR